MKRIVRNCIFRDVAQAPVVSRVVARLSRSVLTIAVGATGLAVLTVLVSPSVSQRGFVRRGGASPTIHSEAAAETDDRRIRLRDATEEEMQALIESTVSRARLFGVEGRFDDAVLEYRTAAALNPGDAVVTAELLESTRLKQLFDPIHLAFEDQDFAGALRMLYRLPEGTAIELVQRYEFVGWYNLGMVSLRAGHCEAALERFREASAIRFRHPRLEEPEQLIALCRLDPDDGAYRTRAYQLQFLGIGP